MQDFPSETDVPFILFFDFFDIGPRDECRGDRRHSLDHHDEAFRAVNPGDIPLCPRERAARNTDPVAADDPFVDGLQRAAPFRRDEDEPLHLAVGDLGGRRRAGVAVDTDMALRSFADPLHVFAIGSDEDQRSDDRHLPAHLLAGLLRLDQTHRDETA